MRLRLTLDDRDRDGSRDVQVTVDALATIGDIAAELAGPTGAHAAPSTLSVKFPGEATSHVLNPLLSISESALRSGASVSVVADANRWTTAATIPVAEVVIVSGPDAGQVFLINAGANFVGSDPACQVRLTDPDVSRRHASITVADIVSITDLNSGSGVRVDGRMTDRAQLTSGTTVTIGGTELRVAPLGAGRAGTRAEISVLPPAGADRAGKAARFSRSPRVDPAYRGSERELPQLPSVPEKQRFPFLAVISPVLIGAGMFAIIQQPYILLFIALSPVIMLGTWIDSRLTHRRRKRDEHARFTTALTAAADEFEAEQEREKIARIAESPSTGEVIAAMRDAAPLMWTRKPEHSTFLELRLGSGAIPSRNTLRMPSRTDADIEYWEQAAAVQDRFSTIAGVPVIENLDRCGALGIAGTGAVASDVARSMVVQLAGLHSPADLVITAFAGGDARPVWEWLKWLPHVDSIFTPLNGSGLAGDFGTASKLAAELEELISDRRAGNTGNGTVVRSRLIESDSADDLHGEAVDRLPALPAVVVLVTADAPVERARLVAIGEDGPDVGVFLIWLAGSVEQLPVVCRTFVDVAEDRRGTVGLIRSGVTVPLTELEAVDELTAANTARLIAPAEDDGARVLDESDLPHSVALLSLFDQPIADQVDAVTERWVKTDSLTGRWVPGRERNPGGLRALVGQGATAPMHLDLRRHGPHALVGGTTGSGKSEFLQTWIMAMAAEYSPDRVTFLLVDYKGGSAFADCVTLPHTVGLVTDLTPPLVRRALTSLRAELRYREQLLNRKNAKDLESLERRADPEAPPVLVLVIDEFAALIGEVPEFVDGVVDIAQRGRSLGIHLIMATQRRAGIIRDNLRANTNLRVALRVADEADSTDVIGNRSAASFDPGTPGRAVAKLGPGRPLDFQTAYLGSITTVGTVDADVEVADLRFGATSPWPAAGPAAAAEQVTDRRDIERLAATIRRSASARNLTAPRRPWLDTLPEAIDVTTTTVRNGIGVGVIDEPEQQRQRPWAIRPDTDGNISILGTGGTGKSTALRTVATGASLKAEKDPVVIYGLDFAGGALDLLEQLPTVASVITGTDRERVARVVKLLRAEADDRTMRFAASRAGNLTDYRAVSGRAGEPRILVLIDGMAAFRAEYEFSPGSLFDDVAKLMGIGRQVGMHFVITADRYAAFPTGMLASIQTRLVLRLASDSDHQIAGVPTGMLTDALPGRAVIGGHEIQLAVTGGTADLTAQAATIGVIAASLRDAGVPDAAPVERLPEVIEIGTLPALVGELPVLGVSDETLDPVGVPLDGLFVVTGPFGSGRTTTVKTIIQSLTVTRPGLRRYLLAGRRSQLAGSARWTGTGIGDSAAMLAVELATEMENADETPQLMVVIEQVSDFEALPAEGDIARLIKAARRAGVIVIAETDTVTGGSAWQIYTELKTARAGIVLQPEETDGVTLFRTAFPRVTRADFPPGRGILVNAGRITRVQVATPTVDAPLPADR